MSNVCEVTGVRRYKVNRVSHANNKTKHYQQPNIQERRFLIPELGQRVKIRISSRGLRTVDKHGGLSRYLVKANPEKLSANLQRVRKILISKGLH
ncbi:MAG: 50S ribosomal protein L28 [uncultured bacterium]|nr:MAG: 50S ribosomal protein L28 [uncultured bacterium]HLD46048.1 50S ribosomal protein L28 [bacterium]